MMTFFTDQEFTQTAINAVSRMIFDRASGVISTGNVADIAEECLTYLELVCVDQKVSPVVVSAYLDIIRNENENIRAFI